MRRYQIEVYVTADGQSPFEAWLADLHDDKARTSFFARLPRQNSDILVTGRH